MSPHPFGPPLMAVPHMDFTVHAAYHRRQSSEERMNHYANVCYSLDLAIREGQRPDGIENLRTMRDIAYHAYTDPFGVKNHA